MDLISSRVLLGAAGAAGGGVSYWFARLNSFFATSVITDGDNNICVVGGINGTSPAIVLKLDLDGNIVWQRSITTSVSSGNKAVGVDDSGNVYVSGYDRIPNLAYVRKYDSSGVLQWQRQIGGTSITRFYGSAVSSSGDVYAVGVQSAQGAGSNDGFVVKYNSSGVLQWQRALGGSGNDNSSAVAIDSSGNICHVGNSASTGGITLSNGYIEKLNSSGTSQWKKLFARPSSGSILYGVVIDPSDDSVYVSGRGETTYYGDTDIIIGKFSSAGNLLWQRVIGNNAANRQNDGDNRIALDSLGNLYVTFSSEPSTRKLCIAKYNSSGTLQWQRTITCTGSEVFDTSVYVDLNDDLVLLGDGFIAKLPSDGSLTGVYGIFTYAVSSFSQQAASETVANATNLSQTVTTLTSSASSMADGAGTATSTVTTI